MEAKCARLASVSRMSFRAIAESSDIHSWTKHDGHEIPSTHHTVKKVVLDYAEKIKQTFIAFLLMLIAAGTTFTFCFDDWSAPNRERYLNLYLSDGKNKYNLGLHHIKGPLPADKLDKMLGEVLEDFGLSWSNIIAVSMDGCSVNCEIREAHGIHLAVCKQFFGKKVEKCDDDDDDDNDSQDENNNENHSAIDGGEHEDDEDYTLAHVDELLVESDDEIHSSIKQIYKKVRETCKLIRSKRDNRDKLRSYITDRGLVTDPLVLMLDMKTRWNSSFLMMKRFYLLEDAVQKTLIDIKSDINFTAAEIHQVGEIV